MCRTPQHVFNSPEPDRHSGAGRKACVWPHTWVVTEPNSAAANDDLRRVLSHLYPPVTVSSDNAARLVSGFATFTPQPEHAGAPEWMQGGLSATVLDYVAARIANQALSSKVATGTLDLRYRRPVLLTGGPYRVEGSAPIAGGRTTRVRAAILSSDGRPLVEASALFVAVDV